MDYTDFLTAVTSGEREYLQSIPLFVISDTVAKAVVEVTTVWLHDVVTRQVVKYPVNARLPANSMLVYKEGLEILYYCHTSEAMVRVEGIHPDGSWDPVGWFIPGGMGGVHRDWGDDNTRTLKLHNLMLVAHAVSMINTPAYTVARPLVRQQKRAHARTFGQTSAERIRVIEWDLTKPKLAAGESVGSGRHMPLHYTRGHWRKCEAHHNGATTHDDGIVRQWIEGFWSGHPAYGTIKAVYAPTIGAM